MAWMIIVSTLSGENFTLWRDRECERPRDMVLTSDGRRPGMREVRWVRMPR